MKKSLVLKLTLSNNGSVREAGEFGHRMFLRYLILYKNFYRTRIARARIASISLCSKIEK